MPNAIGLSDARQPRYAASINRSLPVSRGLVGAIHWGWQHNGFHNAALRTRGTAYSLGANLPQSYKPGVGFGGMQGLENVTTGAGSAHLVALNEVDLGFKGFTIYMLTKFTDTTLRGASYFGALGGATARAGGHAPFSDGAIYFDYGGAAAPNRISYAFGGKVVNRLDRFAFLRQGAATDRREIWHNGVLRASGTGGGDRVAGTGPQFNLLNGNGSLTSIEDTVTIYLALVWNRGLTAGELRQIDHNPWQVFATSDINRSFVPSAAVASTTGRIAGFGSFGALGAG